MSSAATKKKHVYNEIVNEFNLPEANQQVVRIKGPRGNNLHDVETATGELFIASMPVKFRKSVWTKRGDFVIVEPIEEGNRVKAEIVKILTKEHIRYMKNENVWPKEFDSALDEAKSGTSGRGGYIDDDMMPKSEEEEYYDDDDQDQS